MQVTCFAPPRSTFSCLDRPLRRNLAWASFTATAMALLWLLAPEPAHAANPPVATLTQLTLTNALTGQPVSQVKMFTVVTLTAKVKPASPVPNTNVTQGTIAFCEDDSVGKCLDGNAIGLMQVRLLPGPGPTPNFGATLNVVPTFGTHSFHAVFLGTNATSVPVVAPAFGPSTSPQKALQVIGPPLPGVTSSSLTSSGTPGHYTLKANILGTGAGYTALTGSVSFLDTTNSNALLGTSAVGPTSYVFSFAQPPLTPTMPALPPAYLSNLGAAVNTKTNFAANINPPFNDGSPDLIFIVPNPIPNNYEILVLMNQLSFGAPSFQPVTPPGLIPGTAYPLAVATGDFNNDGNADLAIATDDGSVYTFQGPGFGVFGIPTTIESGSFMVNALAVADPAKTGLQNIYGITPVGLITFPNLGAGTFGSPVIATYSTWDWDWTSSLAMGRFVSNLTDLAFPVVTNPNLNSISLLQGTSGLGLSVATFPVGNNPSAIVTADFNGDGYADVAVANSGDNTVSILAGDGNGNFTTKSTVVAGDMPMYLQTGDFNGDGIADLAAGNAGDGSVTILLGKGDGTFKTSTIPGDPTAGLLGGVLAADFNADGFSDVVAVNSQVPELFLGELLASSNATLTGVAVAGTGTHQAVANYPGDSHYAGSSSNLVGLTAQALNTTLKLKAQPSPASWGQSVTLTATLNPYTAQGHSTNGESVTFYDGTTPLGTRALASGVVTLASSTLSVGSHNLKAVYGGDANFAGSTSSVLVFTVNKAASTTTLTAASNAPTVGNGDLLTATVSGFSAPRGVVDFKQNGVTICSVALGSNGKATCSWAPWTTSQASLTATYQGDGNHLGSTSSTLKLTPTYPNFNANVVLTVGNLQLTYPGQTQTVTCIRHSGNLMPTGSVKIYDDTTVIQTLGVGGDGCAYWYINPGLHAGTQHLRAYYSGDSHFRSGYSAITNVNVSRLATYWSVQCPQNIRRGQDEQCSVSIWSNLGAPPGNITFRYDGAATQSRSIGGGTIFVTIPTPRVGNHSIVFAYPGSGDFAPIPAQTQNFTVSQ
jgi:hypothetical protein